jgi:hypothetical protein
MRTTRKQIEAAFHQFATAHGERVATAYNDVGALELDYAPLYGGYRINRIVTEGDGVSMPYGERRYSPAQMLAMLQFATVASQ